MSIPRSIQLGALLALMLAFAMAANARTLSMTGEWFQNRGPLIDIPSAGGQIGCGGGAPNGCIANLKPINGGIPGAASVAGESVWHSDCENSHLTVAQTGNT